MYTCQLNDHHLVGEDQQSGSVHIEAGENKQDDCMTTA